MVSLVLTFCPTVHRNATGNVKLLMLVRGVFRRGPCLAADHEQNDCVCITIVVVWLTSKSPLADQSEYPTYVCMFVAARYYTYVGGHRTT